MLLKLEDEDGNCLFSCLGLAILIKVYGDIVRGCTGCADGERGSVKGRCRRMEEHPSFLFLLLFPHDALVSA